MTEPRITVVVGAYDMARELPRTLLTLMPPYQQGVAAEDIEVVVADNGSPLPVEIADNASSPVKLLRVDDAPPSPVDALNAAFGLTSAPIVGLMVDGARMASPGLLSTVDLAMRLGPRTVVTTVAYHLGYEVQMISVGKGYDTAAEDALLASVPWQTQGYRLFEVSSLAGSSREGWFMPISESNAIFMRRELWQELGLLDPAFRSPGGGLVNHDVYRRACELPDVLVVNAIGEGTFHQVHGGVATNRGYPGAWDVFHEEYRTIRGMDYRTPAVLPLHLGRVRPEHRGMLARSLTAMTG